MNAIIFTCTFDVIGIGHDVLGLIDGVPLILKQNVLLWLIVENKMKMCDF